MKTVTCKVCDRVLPVKRSTGVWWWLTAELCPQHPTGDFNINLSDAEQVAA